MVQTNGNNKNYLHQSTCDGASVLNKVRCSKSHDEDHEQIHAAYKTTAKTKTIPSPSLLAHSASKVEQICQFCLIGLWPRGLMPSTTAVCLPLGSSTSYLTQFYKSATALISVVLKKYHHLHNPQTPTIDSRHLWCLKRVPVLSSSGISSILQALQSPPWSPQRVFFGP